MPINYTWLNLRGHVLVNIGDRGESGTAIFKQCDMRAMTVSSTESQGTDFWSIFANSPLPRWIFDQDSLKFLEVNQAAEQNYGYTRDEFLKLSILDIRPLEDIPALLHKTLHPQLKGPSVEERWRHRRKDGRVFDVEITSVEVSYCGRPAEAVTAITHSDLTPLCTPDLLLDFMSGLCPSVRETLGSPDGWEKERELFESIRENTEGSEMTSRSAFRNVGEPGHAPTVDGNDGASAGFHSI